MHIESCLEHFIHLIIGVTCHNWICDLMNMCIGEIWWFSELYENCDLIYYDTWWFMWLVNNVNLFGDVYMMMFVIFGDACTLGEFTWWWFPCLYFWNDELYLLSWLDKSLCGLYDWCELDELYVSCEICTLCKMSGVACMIILSKWWSWCNLMIGMTIGPRPDGHPQKIPAMGRVKPRFYGYGLGSG